MAYSSQEIMNQLYGANNINLWAAPNGDEDADDITTNCGYFIAYADALIDAVLKAKSTASFKIPLATTPTLIQFISGHLATVLMYERWGLSDVGKQNDTNQLAPQEARAMKMLAEIASKDLVIDL